MKKILHFLTLLALILFTTTIKAQLTKLTTSTNIKNGVALGSIGVMADNDGVLWRTDGTPAGTFSYSETKIAKIENKPKKGLPGSVVLGKHSIAGCDGRFFSGIPHPHLLGDLAPDTFFTRSHDSSWH